jgi:hypothetical protein
MDAMTLIRPIRNIDDRYLVLLTETVDGGKVTREYWIVGYRDYCSRAEAVQCRMKTIKL